jgi:hypothetical protein
VCQSLKSKIQITHSLSVAHKLLAVSLRVCVCVPFHASSTHTHKSYICICLSFILSSCFHRQTQTMKMKFLHMILMMFILILHKPIWILASIVDPLVPSPQISPFSPILTSITVSASSPGTTFSLSINYF